MLRGDDRLVPLPVDGLVALKLGLEVGQRLFKTRNNGLAVCRLGGDPIDLLENRRALTLPK